MHKVIVLKGWKVQMDSKTNNRYNSSTIQNRGIPHGPAVARYICLNETMNFEPLVPHT
jgi:hypothetical protein